MTIRRRKLTTYEWDCKCERCGYAWKTTGAKPPGRCPGCKARGWEKAARPYVRKAR